MWSEKILETKNFCILCGPFQNQLTVRLKYSNTNERFVCPLKWICLLSQIDFCLACRMDWVKCNLDPASPSDYSDCSLKFFHGRRKIFLHSLMFLNDRHHCAVWKQFSPQKFLFKKRNRQTRSAKKFGFCPNQRVRSFTCCFALELSSVHRCVESPTA